MVELTIKKRHAIKKSQLASLMQKLTDTIGSDAALYNAPMIEIAETASKFNIYIIDKKPLIMEQDTWAFPTLRGAVLRPFSGHRIVVDMGAVPYMINGADVLLFLCMMLPASSRWKKERPQRICTTSVTSSGILNSDL